MDILTVMINAVRGKAVENYSMSDTNEVIRKALIEANGGSTKINLKTFHRGSELYSLVEELIPAVINDGLKEDCEIFKLVEYRNIADGDEATFNVEDPATFVVADAAAGIKGVRRQRISGGMSVPVKTSVKIVRVYEELNRLLSGKIDFQKFITAVADSFKKQVLADAYKAISGLSANTAGLDNTYVTGGTYDEDELIALVEHVEAATGKTARIYGTKAALRKVKTATVSHEAEADLYNIGFYGKFNGTDMVCLKQAHKAGTSAFILDDTKIYVIAGDDKPIKVVNEGDGILFESEPTANADLTKEYVYGQGAGVGVICAEKLGVYNVG